MFGQPPVEGGPLPPLPPLLPAPGKRNMTGQYRGPSTLTAVMLSRCGSRHGATSRVTRAVAPAPAPAPSGMSV